MATQVAHEAAGTTLDRQVMDANSEATLRDHICYLAYLNHPNLFTGKGKQLSENPQTRAKELLRYEDKLKAFYGFNDQQLRQLRGIHSGKDGPTAARDYLRRKMMELGKCKLISPHPLVTKHHPIS